MQLSLFPSTSKQKAKARKSREMDMMSDFEKMDVMIAKENTNPIERELSNMIENVVNDQDIESIPQSSRYETHENKFGHYAHENAIPRQDKVQETLETFTSELNIRISQEMDSMMSLMHSQINRAISTATTERVIPEIQNTVSSISSSGNRDTQASLSPNRKENAEMNNGLRNKILKKDSRSTGDLRTPRDSCPYMVTGATDTQRQIPEFLSGRIHSHLNLERQNRAIMSPWTLLYLPHSPRYHKHPRTR